MKTLNQAVVYFSQKIKEALMKFVENQLIISYNDNYHHDINKVGLSITFRHDLKNLNVSQMIDLSQYPYSTNWYDVISSIIFSRIKGEKAEQRIFQLLQKWKKTHMYDIREVYRASDYTDKKIKADIIVIIQKNLGSGVTGHQKTTSLMVYLQVKSSEGYQHAHKQKSPWAPSIVVNDHISDHTLYERFGTICNSFIAVTEMNILIQLLKLTDKQSTKQLKLMRDKYLVKLHM